MERRFTKWAVRRVTMQDIADACGLSRNTVSKIFNNRGSVPQATQELVLKKAQELGYIQPPPRREPPARPAAPSSCSPATCPSDFHFGTFFIPAFADQLSRVGYTLMMCEVTPAERKARRLPAHVALERTAGLLTIELFDREYLNMLCDLDRPVILVDGYYGANVEPLRCDTISMENIPSMVSITGHILAAGAKRTVERCVIRHCNSFQERWQDSASPWNRRAWPWTRPAAFWTATVTCTGICAGWRKNSGPCRPCRRPLSVPTTFWR